MYDGEVNPSVWLDDYHLTFRVVEGSDDHFIIQYLPIYLGTRPELGSITYPPTAFAAGWT
jgi:hypothetical protein